MSEFDSTKNQKKTNKTGNDQTDAYRYKKESGETNTVFELQSSANFYFNNHKRVGYAIIFNHEIIKDQKRRVGTKKDKTDLTNCLESLGFQVVCHDDLTFEDIIIVLTDAAQEDYSDYDCFCIVVLSHGETGKVFASDKPYPVERLWKPFLGYACPSLINKPKLFFIQACRGTNLEFGVQYRGFITARGINIFSYISSILNVLRHFLRGVEKIDNPDAEPLKLLTYEIPSTADLLVMYSTYDGYYSWRNTANGSWFIQSLCGEIKNFIKSDKQEVNLFHLLIAVCRRVAYEYQSHVPQEKYLDEIKEMPQIVSTLTKIFNLRKKINL